MMDLLLINPSLDFETDLEKFKSLRVESAVPRQQAPHIGIGYMLAIAKLNGFKAKYIDMVAYEVSIDALLRYIDENKPSLIGLTAYTTQIKAAGAIAKKIKEHSPSSRICVGGSHTTAMPKETLEEFDGFDFAICGESELVLPQILNNIKNGTPLSGIKGVATRERTTAVIEHCDAVKNIDDLPFPAWGEFDLSKYPGADPHCTKLELPMSSSRGCPFSCVFCARPFGRQRRARSIASIIEEIERDVDEFGCEAIYFTDETFIADLEWSKELFRTMIKRGIQKKVKWSCAGRVDIASPELYRLMKEAGCYYIFFGFESGDDGMLKNANKGFTVSHIKQAVQWAKDAGLVCAGSFIIGLPGETAESANKSIKLAKELNIYSTSFPIAVPLPGTVLREMAKRNEYGLRILSNDWDDYGKQYPGVMDSKQLKIEELRALQKKAYEYNPKKEYFSYIASMPAKRK